jgi:hypothetical protein
MVMHMKTLFVLLLAASFPAYAAPAKPPGADAPTGSKFAAVHRICTQVSVRAGSRMSGRRVCLTADQWRQALGPDWRSQLRGARNLELDYEALDLRSRPTDRRQCAMCGG